MALPSRGPLHRLHHPPRSAPRRWPTKEPRQRRGSRSGPRAAIASCPLVRHAARRSANPCLRRTTPGPSRLAPNGRRRRRGRGRGRGLGRRRGRRRPGQRLLRRRPGLQRMIESLGAAVDGAATAVATTVVVTRALGDSSPPGPGPAFESSAWARPPAAAAPSLAPGPCALRGAGPGPAFASSAWARPPATAAPSLAARPWTLRGAGPLGRSRRHLGWRPVVPGPACWASCSLWPLRPSWIAPASGWGRSL
mmetsp:Transcript_28873/g.81034  ORF Transcript_28873/g.81034 Transcript_28873/m.81034 type:complete len:251 (-) Transcript_28873:668-1420(-)